MAKILLDTYLVISVLIGILTVISEYLYDGEITRIKYVNPASLGFPLSFLIIEIINLILMAYKILLSRQR